MEIRKNYYYSDFQDAFFMDIAWNNTGEATNCSWTLNFNKNRKENPNNKSQVKFIIQLEKINDTFFNKFHKFEILINNKKRFIKITYK